MADTATRNNVHTHTDRRISTETKSSFKTTELIAYVVAVVGVLVASAAGRRRQRLRHPGGVVLHHAAHHRLHGQPWPGEVRQPRLLRRRRRARLALSPIRVRPLGGGLGCLIMIAVSVGLSVLLTVLLNLGR